MATFDQVIAHVTSNPKGHIFTNEWGVREAVVGYFLLIDMGREILVVPEGRKGKMVALQGNAEDVWRRIR